MEFQAYSVLVIYWGDTFHPHPPLSLEGEGVVSAATSAPNLEFLTPEEKMHPSRH